MSAVKPQDFTKVDTMRHSAAHVLAAAVQEMFPDAKFGVGPVVENGFFYDMELPRSLTPLDLQKIEKRMRDIIAKNPDFVREEMPIEDAIRMFKEAKQDYKVQLLNDLKTKGTTSVSEEEAGAMEAGASKVSIYRTGKFIDLCRGPHVAKAKDIGAVKIKGVAGAYWRGNEKNPMLQRVYGYAFPTQRELDDFLKMMEEAEKRDHRRLGKELKLFTFSDLVGPGLPLWLPNGSVLTEELEKLAKEAEFRAGFCRVRTPHLAKEVMYKTSGHLPYYADSMFPPMTMKEDGGDTVYYLKAMNCPHHHQIYASEPRSYRDLPLRLAEYGTCYRYEQSGELMGLMRVRSMNMNDAHIYCTPEQFAAEFKAVNAMYLSHFKIFGLKKYVMRFSTHDPRELGKKFINDPELWKQTEDLVRQTLIDQKINYVEVPNEAAFYGPKIDVQVWSSIGREFTIATNQVDFAVPGRFGLTYVDKDGTEKTPLCIHRAPLGTHERFIGFLIEHYAGAFPLWLAPIQIQVIPVGKDHWKTARKLQKMLVAEGIRSAYDELRETVGYKIRKAEKMKVPYMLVIGDKEKSLKTVNVRVRGRKKEVRMTLKSFIAKVKDEISKRK
jgi:threonyl-tRNA synthetase